MSACTTPGNASTCSSGRSASRARSAAGRARRSGSGSRAAAGSAAARARRAAARRARSAARPRRGRRRSRAARGRPSGRRGCARRTRRRRRAPSGCAISCGKAIPSRRPSASHGARRDALRVLELVAVGRRRVDVDPADAEADPGRPQPVRERQRPRPRRRARSRSRSSRCPRRTPRGSPPASATRRAPRGGARSRSSATSIRKMPRWPPESAGFSTAGKPDRLGAAPAPRRATRTAANGGCGTPSSAKRAAHRDLVASSGAPTSVPIPGSPSAPSTAATTGTARSAETVSAPSTACRRATVEHRVDVGEVDRLADVRHLEPERIRVAVDRDDAEAAARGLQDRAPLVAPGADEEDGLHSAPMLGRSTDECRARSRWRRRAGGTRPAASARSRSRVTTERDPERAPEVDAGDAGGRRAAGDLGAERPTGSGPERGRPRRRSRRQAAAGCARFRSTGRRTRA